MDRAGYHTFRGENVATGFPTAAEVLRFWMEDDERWKWGHRNLILNCLLCPTPRAGSDGSKAAAHQQRRAPEGLGRSSSEDFWYRGAVLRIAASGVRFRPRERLVVRPARQLSEEPGSLLLPARTCLRVIRCDSSPGHGMTIAKAASGGIQIVERLTQWNTY
jgi:hypothetical protein